MPTIDWVSALTFALPAAAAVFSFVVLLRTSGNDRRQLTEEAVSRLLRDEADRIRLAADEQARGLRQELSENVRRFQDTTINVLGELSDALGVQIVTLCGRLDSGIKTIDERATAIGKKLDEDLGRMSDEANHNRDCLRETLETKLDDTATKQASAAKELREETAVSVRQLGSSVAETLNHLSSQQKERLENVTLALTSLTDNQGKTQEALRRTLESRLESSINVIAERAMAIGTKLDEGLTQLAKEANHHRDCLRETLESKLGDIVTKQVGTAKELREETNRSFQQLGSSVAETLNQLSSQQKERLENVTVAIVSSTEKQEKAQEGLRRAVEGRLDVIRTENAAKLEEIRGTVDERLQQTLEARLGESFHRVVEQLERVYKGIGEMQSLAAGVGDLKKVLSNVRVRGTYGEIQLAMLLEQFLSPEQIIKNAQIKENTQERVEFAIRLPGRDGEHEVLLPIDAKFPQEDWERLMAASDAGDAEVVAEAGRSLENRIKCFAKSIKEKYISPPTTTDFAILFLPTESLYAEVLRRPGLFENLQREHHVTLTGPTTFTALVNALQVGFRSLAIEKRSSEVWQILGAVRTEFGRYNEVVDRLAKQLNTAAKSVESLGVRTRAMNRRLRDVERLPDETAKMMLDSQLNEASEPEDDDAIAA